MEDHRSPHTRGLLRRINAELVFEVEKEMELYENLKRLVFCNVISVSFRNKTQIQWKSTCVEVVADQRQSGAEFQFHVELRMIEWNALRPPLPTSMN